jgi:hypothetical protein
MADPLGGCAGEFESAHHQHLEMSTMDPLGGGARESESVHHQHLETWTIGPLGGAGAGDPGAPTIHAKNVGGGPHVRRC